MKYEKQGSFGYVIKDEVKTPAAEVFEEDSALHVASVLLAIYSAFESKVDDSDQFKFQNDVQAYFDLAFENRHDYLNKVDVPNNSKN